MANQFSRFACVAFCVAIAITLHWKDVRLGAKTSTICTTSANQESPSVSSTFSRRRLEIGRTTKAIQHISAGDVVLAVDEATGKRVPRRVVRTFKRVTDHLRLLTVRGSEGPEQRIETTDEHPFWVEGKGWVAAGELRPGDELTEAGGQPAALVATEYAAHPEGVTVYNFEVEELHSYFVAAHGARAPPLLVHNACNIVTVEQVLEQTAKNLDRGASSAHQGLLAGSHVIPSVTVTKAVNSDLIHAVERSVTRNVVKDPKVAADKLRQLTKQITTSGLPLGTIPDPRRVDSVAVPFEGGWAIYEIAKNGTAKLRTVIDKLGG